MGKKWHKFGTNGFQTGCQKQVFEAKLRIGTKPEISFKNNKIQAQILYRPVPGDFPRERHRS